MSDDSEQPTTLDFIAAGGMRRLVEVAGQIGVALRNKYFDVYTTYAPTEWLGTRPLTEDELDQINRERSGD